MAAKQGTRIEQLAQQATRYMILSSDITYTADTGICIKYNTVPGTMYLVPGACFVMDLPASMMRQCIAQWSVPGTSTVPGTRVNQGCSTRYLDLVPGTQIANHRFHVHVLLMIVTVEGCIGSYIFIDKTTLEVYFFDFRKYVPAGRMEWYIPVPSFLLDTTTLCRRRYTFVIIVFI